MADGLSALTRPVSMLRAEQQNDMCSQLPSCRLHAIKKLPPATLGSKALLGLDFLTAHA